MFNDKNPSRNPVTGETADADAVPFDDAGLRRSPGRPTAAAYAQSEPRVHHHRARHLLGERVHHQHLRGVGVTVYLIGSTTCGKPYGFYPTDNCGTTYFSIQFRGENAANFGDYTDGFSPANTHGERRARSVPGCSVADDFTHALGDAAEAPHRRGAALSREQQPACARPPSGASDPRLSKASFRLRRTAACGCRSPPRA